MTGIKIRDLGEDYSWGSIVEGVNWETMKDEDVRERLAGVLHAVSHLTSASHEQAEAIHSNDWRTAVQRRNARYTVDGGQA